MTSLASGYFILFILELTQCTAQSVFIHEFKNNRFECMRGQKGPFMVAIKTPHVIIKQTTHKTHEKRTNKIRSEI